LAQPVRSWPSPGGVRRTATRIDWPILLGRIEPLAPKLGTLMLQLPPRAGAPQLPRLARFLGALPRGYRYAVELRHEDFYRGGPEEDAAMDLLRAHAVDLVMMDTRALHTSKSLAFADVRARKPNFPVVVRATAAAPIVRFVPQESLAASRPFLDLWPPALARWIGEGKRPFFFMHSPDDTLAPENAYAFHALLRAIVDVGDLPAWPGAPRQLGLFP